MKNRFSQISEVINADPIIFIFLFYFMKSGFLMYIRKENMQNRPRRLGNAIFRFLTIFVNKNYSDGVLTYLWAREMCIRFAGCILGEILCMMMVRVTFSFYGHSGHGRCASR